ncbi:MAG: response regulator transcription factor [Dehalococcoidales bacterium]|nr:response regulator transcription factor [Dehalococcoidales bacterium]
MADKHILVIEDDTTLLEMLKYNLIKEGYEVATATDGVQGLESARTQKPDFIILDVMLPKMNGFEVCRILRQEMTVPIFILTAKDDEIDKVVGLDLGADDYLTKPFKMRELLARIRAIFRRSEIRESSTGSSDTLIKTADMEIDVARHKVTLKGISLDLTPKEFELLSYMARNPGIVFNREQVLEKVWGYDYPGDTRTVDVHIRWLREKIEENPEDPKYLITLRGVGYKFEG